MAESFPATLFLATIQAVGVPGRTESSRNRTFPARRLAHAQRRGLGDVVLLGDKFKSRGISIFDKGGALFLTMTKQKQRK